MLFLLAMLLLELTDSPMWNLSLKVGGSGPALQWVGQRQAAGLESVRASTRALDPGSARPALGCHLHIACFGFCPVGLGH